MMTHKETRIKTGGREMIMHEVLYFTCPECENDIDACTCPDGETDSKSDNDVPTPFAQQYLVGGKHHGGL